MYKYSILIFVLLFTITASAQNKSLPDITELMKSVRDNQENLEKLLENYTFIQDQKELEKDKNGNLAITKSKTYHMTFYKGQRILRLIAENGKPLSIEDEADELKKIEKKITKIDKGKFENKKYPSIGDVLRVSTTYNARWQSFNDRDCIAFDFKPNPKIKAKTKFENSAQKMAGAIFVDPQDKQIVKMEARFVKPIKIAGGLFATVKEGSTFAFEQNRINNEIWLPSKFEMNFPIKVFMVKTIHVNQLVTYSDYKRFNVKSEKEKLIDPK